MGLRSAVQGSFKDSEISGLGDWLRDPRLNGFRTSGLKELPARIVLCAFRDLGWLRVPHRFRRPFRRGEAVLCCKMQTRSDMVLMCSCLFVVAGFRFGGLGERACAGLFATSGVSGSRDAGSQRSARKCLLQKVNHQVEHSYHNAVCPCQLELCICKPCIPILQSL